MNLETFQEKTVIANKIAKYYANELKINAVNDDSKNISCHGYREN